MEVHAKVNESPLDAFALVLFLLQHEHVMVKELLQFLVGEVNAELFKTVELQGCVRGVKLWDEVCTGTDFVPQFSFTYGH